MKVRDLIILIKYAQGSVVFNSFMDYVKFLKHPQRAVLLSEIVVLTDNWQLQNSDGTLAIEKSELDIKATPCQILQQGVSIEQLQKIIELPESELESSFKLLLTLFSIGYQREFPKNRNAPDKLWYWDYSQVENSLKLVKLDDQASVDLDQINRRR